MASLRVSLIRLNGIGVVDERRLCPVRGPKSNEALSFSANRWCLDPEMALSRKISAIFSSSFYGYLPVKTHPHLHHFQLLCPIASSLDFFQHLVVPVSLESVSARSISLHAVCHLSCSVPSLYPSLDVSSHTSIIWSPSTTLSTIPKMLPDFLQSSLKVYKEDTNAIATWLAQKAKQCGYPSDLLDHNEENTVPSKAPQASKRLKGKARKQAKDAANGQVKSSGTAGHGSNVPAGTTYTIKVKDFTVLADHIASSTKAVVKVPKALVHTLNRAINLRRQHCDWSREQQGAGKPTDQVKDEGHWYFLGILERTREILKSRMPSDMVDDFLSKPIGDQTSSQMSNVFANLDIQEPSQAFIDAPDREPAAANASISTPRYEAETLHSLEEQYLGAHCLFEDISKIRDFVGRLWANYQEGMDLVAASITTNTAIDFVRNLEQDYLQQFPEKSDYESIVQMFYKVQCTYTSVFYDAHGTWKHCLFFSRCGPQCALSLLDLFEDHGLSCLKTLAILHHCSKHLSRDILTSMAGQVRIEARIQATSNDQTTFLIWQSTT